MLSADHRDNFRIIDAVTSPVFRRVAWPVGLVLVAVALFPEPDPGNTLSFISIRGVALLAAAVLGLATNGTIGSMIGLFLSILFMTSVQLRSPVSADTALWVLAVTLLVGTAGLAGAAATSLRTARRTEDALAAELAEAERRREIDRTLAESAQSIALTEGLTGATFAAFQRLLEALALDVLIVRRNVAGPDGRPASEVLLWVTRPSGPVDFYRTDNLLEWDRLPAFRKRLERNESFAFASFDELPDCEREYLSAGPARLESAMNLPVWIGGEWLGHVAFAQREPGRDWTPKEIASLRVISDMIGTMWQRDRHTAELRESVMDQRRALKAQHALTEGTRILLSPESDRPLADTLALVMEAVGSDVAYIEHIENDPQMGRVAKPIHQLYRDPSQTADEWAWPLSSEPAGTQKLMSGEVFKFDDQAELNATDPDRVEWLDKPLISEINVPVMPDGETTYIVGVGNLTERTWSASDIEVMTSFARMLGSYFQRVETTRKLEDLVSAKDRFIASVSHELRTPLSVVVGLAAELDRDDDIFTDTERREFMGMIRRQSREVSDIIDDLLVSTRINETSLTVFPEAFDLVQLVGQVIEDLPPEVTAHVSVESTKPVAVVADPVRTRQIVRNLLTNAHRYGGDRVFIRVDNADGLARLDVADTGAGVSPERRDSIFDAYHTSGEERIVTAAIGLGLTVSRQLAQLMGGNVSYLHEDLPTFRLSLPTGGSTEMVSAAAESGTNAV